MKTGARGRFMAALAAFCLFGLFSSSTGSGAVFGNEPSPPDAGPGLHGPIGIRAALKAAIRGGPASGEGTDPGKLPEPTGPRGIDLQAVLDAKVKQNNGYGGGVFRMSSPAAGVLFEGVSGDAVHGTQIPMKPRDTFEIASTSKTFTAVTALLLMEKGLLKLDDPIGDYLPPAVTGGLLVINGHDYGPEITIRQLLDHTGGLPDYWYDPPYVIGTYNAFLVAYYLYPDHFWKPEELLAFARRLTPIARPGKVFRYSDTGYVLLGLLIEKVTGWKLHQVYRQLLFRPLGMTDTYLGYREPPASPYLESHRYEGRRDMHGITQQSADWGGGGLVSSTRDLEKFSNALFHGDVFSDPHTLETMKDWISTGSDDVYYGLGIFRITLDYGLGELWGHDGYGNSWMYYWPQQDITMTGTLNQARNDWWGLVAAAIVSVVTG